MTTLAARLRSAREELGFSQAELARRAGVASSTISSIEQGRNKGSTKIVPIAKALGVREEWLVNGKGKKKAGIAPAPDEDYFVVAKTPEEAAEQLLRHGDEAVLQLLAAIMKLKGKH